MELKKRALIVGINDYPGGNKLNCCSNDATELSKLLEKNESGSPNFESKLYLDVKTKSQLKEYLVDLFKGNCETELFYFSGHGYLNTFGGYIVTPDFKEYDEGVSMDDILKLANKSKTMNKIIILDCCHSGKFGNPSDLSSTTSVINEGLTILTASRASESAIEVNGHGVFTNLLLSALNGGAADLLGHITPGSVYAYIDKALGLWDQRPVFKTNVTYFTSLRDVKVQVPIEILRNITKYFPNALDEHKLDPSYEDTNSNDIDHKVIEPYANPNNVKIFKELQQMQSIGLVVPVDTEHMYFAAMKSKSCKLTSLGQHFWRLNKDGRY